MVEMGGGATQMPRSYCTGYISPIFLIPSLYTPLLGHCLLRPSKAARIDESSDAATLSSLSSKCVYGSLAACN